MCGKDLPFITRLVTHPGRELVAGSQSTLVTEARSHTPHHTQPTHLRDL